MVNMMLDPCPLKGDCSFPENQLMSALSKTYLYSGGLALGYRILQKNNNDNNNNNNKAAGFVDLWERRVKCTMCYTPQENPVL